MVEGGGLLANVVEVDTRAVLALGGRGSKCGGA